MSMQRYSPYGTPSLFNVRNARMAYNIGQKAGTYARKAYQSYANKPKGTPMKTTHTTQTVKSKTGRGYKKVHKDKVTSKHARKAIANVVKTELNKEIELKKSAPLWYDCDTNGGIAHRVWYAIDLASQLVRGDGSADYSGDKAHLTSVEIKGWSKEVLGALRGLDTSLEAYVIEKKGGFSGTTSPTWGNGMVQLVPEDQIVKAETAADNSADGRFAPLAPAKRKFKVLGKKVIRAVKNNKAPLGTTENAAKVKSFDFRMKIDRTVKPYGAMSGEETTDLNRVFLIFRGWQNPHMTYGASSVFIGGLQTRLCFRDA